MSPRRRACTLLSIAVLLMVTQPFAAAEEGARAIPFLEKTWTQPTLRDEATRGWVLRQAVRQTEDRGQAVLPAYYPLAVGDRVFFRSYGGVHAVNLKTGKLEWESDSRWGLGHLLRDSNRAGTVNQWLSAYLAANRPEVLFENSTLGTLSTDGQRLFVVEDLGIAPFLVQVQNPFANFPPGPASPLNEAAQHNRLQGYDLRTGKLVWELGGTGTEDFDNSFFLGAPLVLDGKLLVLNEKAGNLRLVCLDGQGRPQWTQFLASFRQHLDNDPERRMRAAALAHADGVLVVPTNAGLVLGFDLATRTILWIHPYRDPTPQAGDTTEDGQLLQPPPPSPLPPAHWKLTAPCIQDGKVVFTAPDSPSLVCLDLHDGSILWHARAQRDDLYLAGILDHKVLIVTRKSCRALDLADGKPVWTVETGMPSGRGVAQGDVYYLPLRNTLRRAGETNRGPEVCAIDVEHGQVCARTQSRKREIPGNLVIHDGSVISQTVETVSVYPQLRVKLAEIDARLKNDPQDPTGLTERGALLLSRGDSRAAVDDLHEALAQHPPAEIEAQARKLLYETLTELLRRDFAHGEKYLDEYEKLCRVEVPAGSSPEQKQALEAERQRRRADYFFLLARGREQQGRLTQALQAYLDFVAVAGKEEMVSSLDDPAVKAPRDVWAAGRITALVTGANPEQRRTLEAELDRRWKTLQAAGNEQTLEAFVRVLGPSAGVGREARLLLAEHLLRTGVFLDTERQLLPLAAVRDDRRVAARATELLARLYTQAGLLDDAVAAYRVLVRDFADVTVREGKTGVDLWHEVAVDKLFLPYLEETGPLARRIKVEQKEGSFAPAAQLITCEPAGEVPPSFQRQRLAVDLPAQQFRLADPQTGTERWRVNMPSKNFPAFAAVVNTNVPIHLPYHTVGHLVVLQLGQIVYGLDPVTRRLRWEKNLGQDSTPSTNNAVMARFGSLVPAPQESLTQNPDQVVCLGSTAVCLPTHEGLLGVDPQTGKLLWSRDDVHPNSDFFGDDEYLFVVEKNPEGQPTATRVLRAADGVAVTAPDFSALYAQQRGILGRHLLLSDTDARGALVLRLHDLLTGKDAWSQTFSAGSLALQSDDPNLTGAIDPDGRFTVIDLRTRRPLVTATVDPGFLTGARQPSVWLDGAQVYLACNSPLDLQVFSAGPPTTNVTPNAGVRSAAVNGWVFAFSRDTGKERWRVEAPNQRLLLDQFAEVPVLVFTNRYQKVLRSGDNQFIIQGATTRIVDRRTGKLLFDEPEGQGVGQQPYHAYSWNGQTGTLELVNANRKLTLTVEK